MRIFRSPEGNERRPFDVVAKEDEEECREMEECTREEEENVWARESAKERRGRAALSGIEPSRVSELGGETAAADRDIARRLNG
jgi:hypothetical protein